MRLRKIRIGKYKNLKDFECEFGESNISAFIGDNGSGKSNLLEAIVNAFSLTKNRTMLNNSSGTIEAELDDCMIEYELGEETYTLYCDCEKSHIVHGAEKLTKKEIEEALPSNIIVYYAGETQRLEFITEDTLDRKYDSILKGTTDDSFPGFKFMDYFSTKDLDLLFLTATVYRGDYLKVLLDLLGCVGIGQPQMLTFKNPKGKSGRADIYWGARGFVKSFLDEIKKTVIKTKDLGDKYIMVPENVTLMSETSEDEGEFFAKLKALRNAGYLSHVHLYFENREGGIFEYTDLSEGEKQLSLVFLLTAFTAQKDCLYIFDEFDAYLHLNWQRRFAKLLNDVNVNGHVLFTTHSPATISKMQKEDVFIFKEGKVYQTLSDTYNRSLDEIMEEQLHVSLRPLEYTELVKVFRNAVMHGDKEKAAGILDEIKMLVGDDDPFLITARIVMRRME